MKKIFIALALIAAGSGFTSCSSDDDQGSAMLGDWKAVEFTYQIPDSDETHTFPFNMITNGCDVDELDLEANNTADLETEAKVNETCVESHTTGTWNETSVTINGEENPREVISVTNTELKLKYVMTYENFGTTEVTVKYTKQ